MKLPPLLPIFLFLANFAQGAIIPVSEDTYSANNGKIARGYGKHPTLSLAPKGAAVLLRFDVNDFAGLIAADRVSSARVILDITKVRKPGSLKFHRVTSEWTESANGLREAPSFLPTPFATLPADTVKTEQFAMIDLTAEVKQWLTAPGTDFGIAITSTEANLDFASKEGAAEGEPAWLEIESLQVTGNEQIAPGVDAAKLGDGSVNNAEFSFLDGVLAPIQSQLNAVSTAASQAVSKVSTEPELRIIRGTITWQNGAPTITEGSGFTVTRTSLNRFLVSFSQAFSDVPTVALTYQISPDGPNYHLATHLVGATPASTSFHSQIDDLPTSGAILHFIAIGPR